MKVDFLESRGVDFSKLETATKGATVAEESHVARVEEECLAFEPVSQIVALVNQVWADETLSHFCLIERVWAALCLVSFWALGKRFWLFVHNWVFVGG